MAPTSHLPTHSPARKPNDNLTFVIPAFNSAEHVDTAFQVALAAQPRKIIFSDDSSSDSTVTNALHWQRRYPHQITILQHEQNVGPTANWDRAARLVDTPYFIKFDVDDVVHPDYIFEAMTALNGDASIVVSCSSASDVPEDRFPLAAEVTTYLNSHPDVGKPKFYKSNAAVAFIAKWDPYPYSLTTIFKTDAWRAAGGFNGQIRFCGDVEIYFRLLKHGNLIYWPNKVGLYRIGPGGVALTAQRNRTAGRDLLRTYAIAQSFWSDSDSCQIIKRKRWEFLRATLNGTIRRCIAAPGKTAIELGLFFQDVLVFLGYKIHTLTPPQSDHVVEKQPF